MLTKMMTKMLTQMTDHRWQKPKGEKEKGRRRRLVDCIMIIFVIMVEGDYCDYRDYYDYCDDDVILY